MNPHNGLPAGSQNPNAMFKDRKDAAKQLARVLEPLKKDNADLVVLAIPRGGLPIGAILAQSLGAPLDVALSKKLGHPYNREYAIGAVSLKDVVLNDDVPMDPGYIAAETWKIRTKLAEDAARYHEGRDPIDLKDKVVILVDDGIATGKTIQVTARLIKREKPEKLIVAVPVAPPSAIRNLEASDAIDEVVCLLTPRHFQAVGQFYEHFDQVRDDEALEYLREANQAV